MIQFLKYKKIYHAISALVIIVGLISITAWGYTFSVDFVGGSTLEYTLNKPITREVVARSLALQKIPSPTIEIKNKSLTIRTQALTAQQEQNVKTNLEKQASVAATVVRSQTVGPVLGRETMIKTLTASAIAIAGILLYMAYAFKGFNFAVAAVVALFHDLLVVLGVYSLLSHFLGAQFDTLFVTAILTTMSFSVHDTIVIFDKIREYKKVYSSEQSELLANRALTETLIRSINNSMTIIFMLLALILMGGSTIKFFVVALLIGTITGTYSSPFVATPVWVWLEKRSKGK